MITRITVLFLSLFFAFGDFFITVFPKNRLEILRTDESVRFYVDGKNEDETLSYGVVSDMNLFEPDEEIQVVIDNRSRALYGTRAKVTVVSAQADFDKAGYFTFENDNARYTFSFSSALNGIFTVTLKTVENREYRFNIGVMPKNEIAGDNFYYGIQPYITRAKTWDVNNRIPGFDADESIDRILDSAGYLGVNLIREDGIAWSSMQREPYGTADFSLQDYLIGKANARGFRYNWIIGSVSVPRTIKENYRDSYDPAKVWSYPPDEKMWADFAEKLAVHYADNPDVIYEIWNEPNWGFFSGTEEEYFAFLESTSAIIREKNPDAYIYSGGLAVAERDTNMPYLRKSAELIDRGLLDNWGYHNHNGSKDFAEKMRKMMNNARTAGLEKGGINSESGIVGADGSLIARKALYTRSTGSDGYVSFSFRKTVNDPGDVSDFAFFNEYLQPGDAVLTFATVIRFLGNSEFTGNRSDRENIVIDEYKTADGTVFACYSFGKTKRIKTPENVFACYDMYGNPMETGKKIKITENPVYLFAG